MVNNRLLPPNTTDLENNLADTAARVSDVDLSNMAGVWNVDTCPAAFLPWIAWALAVDYWKSEWSEIIKRNYIKQHLESRRTRGTTGSLKQALAALNMDITVVEWWQQQPQGMPGTFYVNVDLLDQGISPDTQTEIDDVIARHKNARSHLTVVNVYQPIAGDMLAAQTLQDSDMVTVYPTWWI